MSSSNVILGVRVIQNQYQRIKVENIDLNGKVEILKEIASQKINSEKDTLELMYAGVILEDGTDLSSYGIKPGVTVHVLPKLKKAETQLKEVPAKEVSQLLGVIENLRSKNILQKLSRSEILQKIMPEIPLLREDPVALAIIQDPELLTLMAEQNTFIKAQKAHPVLGEALRHIVKYLKENVATLTPNEASTSSGYSYSLDALSDDEDMDLMESSREANPLSRNTSFNEITSAQLAAAIASARTNFSSTGAVLNSSNPPEGGIITNEMFGSALEQAFASSPSTRSTEESFETIRARLQPQLEQMKEMGLTNEGQNIRALQATSGDLQAAVELVFNGVVD